MESSSNRRSLLAASIIALTFVSVSVGAGCAAEAPADEPVGSSSDALLMACGTKGTTSYSRFGGGKRFSTGYVEESSKERCEAAACPRPTQAEWAAAYKQAEASMIDDCQDEMSRHTCPAGCKLTVVSSCVAMSAREQGPLNPFDGPLCTENLQLRWQKDCQFAVGVSMEGTAQVTCGPVGSAPIPDGGTTDSGTTDSGTTDSGTTASDGGTTSTDAGTSKTDAGTTSTDAGTSKTDAGS